MTTAAVTSLLARTHARMFWHRCQHSLETNRLLTLTIGSFLVLYGIIAYLMVSKGIDFVHKLPMLGALLTERLIYMLFFFFFVMLVISNATITGMGLFRKRDMDWQIALPIPIRSLILWKTAEGMMLASWGLLVLSAPILIALGRQYDAGWSFYLVGIPSLICLVSLSSNLSTWLLLLLVAYAKRWWWKPGIALAITLLGYVVVNFYFSDPEEAKARDYVANLYEVLRHTEICMHPLLPCSWVSESLLAAAHGTYHRSIFFLLLLLSHALAATVLTGRAAHGLYFRAWDRVMKAAPTRRARAMEHTWYRTRSTSNGRSWWQAILGLDRPALALLRKDIRTFFREPTQWGQSALIFGLLFFYTSNLRRLGYDLRDPFWSSVISHLNLLVCCLALSTLTTRFIYPQFSLEGQRMWILGLSPVPLGRMLALKLRLSAGTLSLLTMSLVLVSSFSLDLPWRQTLFFSAAIMLMSYGLTSLALSLGALIPNFREPNPARIVSGFGGTLCLISSFLYILVSMTLLSIPAWLKVRQGATIIIPESTAIWHNSLSLIGVAGVSALFGGVPYVLAKIRIQRNLGAEL